MSKRLQGQRVNCLNFDFMYQICITGTDMQGNDLKKH